MQDITVLYAPCYRQSIQIIPATVFIHISQNVDAVAILLKLIDRQLLYDINTDQYHKYQRYGKTDDIDSVKIQFIFNFQIHEYHINKTFGLLLHDRTDTPGLFRSYPTDGGLNQVDQVPSAKTDPSKIGRASCGERV